MLVYLSTLYAYFCEFISFLPVILCVRLVLILVVFEFVYGIYFRLHILWIPLCLLICVFISLLICEFVYLFVCLFSCMFVQLAAILYFAGKMFESFPILSLWKRLVGRSF